MPSPQSILVHKYGWLFKDYLNQLAINTTWNLFSPEPASALYARIQLIHPDFDTGEKEIFYPPKKDKRNLNPADRRSYYQFRYLLMQPTRLEEFLKKSLCHSKDKPVEVWLQVYVSQAPTLLELMEEEDPIFEIRPRMNLEKQWRCDSDEIENET